MFTIRSSVFSASVKYSAIKIYSGSCGRRSLIANAFVAN